MPEAGDLQTISPEAPEMLLNETPADSKEMPPPQPFSPEHMEAIQTADKTALAQRHEALRQEQVRPQPSEFAAQPTLEQATSKSEHAEMKQQLTQAQQAKEKQPEKKLRFLKKVKQLLSRRSSKKASLSHRRENQENQH